MLRRFKTLSPAEEWPVRVSHRQQLAVDLDGAERKFSFFASASVFVGVCEFETLMGTFVGREGVFVASRKSEFSWSWGCWEET